MLPIGLTAQTEIAADGAVLLEKHIFGAVRCAWPVGSTAMLISGDYTGEVMLWDVTQRRKIGSLPIKGGDVKALGFLDGSRKFFAGNYSQVFIGSTEPLDQTLTIWQRANSQDYCTSAALSPDQKTLAVSLSEKRVVCYSTADAAVVRTIQPGLVMGAVAYLPDGRLLVSVNKRPGGEIWIYEQGQTTPAQVLPSTNASINALLPSPDGSRVAAIGSDKLLILATKNDAPPLAIEAQLGYLLSLAWFAEGDRVAVGGMAAVNIYDARTGHPVGNIQVGQGQASSLAISSDNQMAIGAGLYIDQHKAPPVMFVRDRAIRVLPIKTESLVSKEPNDAPATRRIDDQVLGRLRAMRNGFEMTLAVLQQQKPDSLTAAIKQYLGSLDVVMKQAAVAGQLAEALRFKVEKDDVLNGAATEPLKTAAKELLQARESYVAAQHAYERELAAKRKAEAERYAKSLKSFQTDLEKQGRPQDARLVQKEIDMLAPGAAP